MAKVPIARPSLEESEVDAVVRVVRSGWITQGPEVLEFEKEFAAAVGAPHAVALANCTVALELALRVVGVGPGDDVLTVSHSFVATANSVVTVGARPVFCDVSADTFGMNPALLERALTPKTKAVLAVHQIGFPCDLPGVLQFAQSHGLPVIEDAACAIGSAIRVGNRWERIGKPHGLIACFSLHPRKIVTTGDGGMLTTADPAIAARVKSLRQHAMSVPDTVRHHSDRVVFESYSEPAYNYRLTDVQAAIGRPQLKRLDAIVAERRRLAQVYANALAGHPLVQVVHEPEWARVNWQSYPVRIKPNLARTQVEIMQFLMDRGVAVKRGISNAHQEPAYADRSRWTCGPRGCTAECGQASCRQLGVSEYLRDSTILIPLFHGMTDAEQQQVIAAFAALAQEKP